LHQQNLLGIVDDKKYAEQRALLDQAASRIHAEEFKRRKEISDKERDKFKSLRDELKTPGQTLREKLNEITKASAAGELGRGQLGQQNRQLAELQAKKTFIESLPDRAQIGDRPSALLQGSAAAFSASFGAKPADKKLADIAKLNEQILQVQRQIEAKLGGTFRL